MQIINLTKTDISLLFKGVSQVKPMSMSKDIIVTRDMVRNYMVQLANVHQMNVVFLVTEDERFKFNDIFSVFPLINLREAKDIKEYNPGDEVPPGASIVTDPYYIDPVTKQVIVKQFLVLPSVTVASAKPTWEDPLNPGISTDKVVRFIELLEAEYNALPVKVENVLYFILDKRVIYKGETFYTAIRNIDDLAEVKQIILEDLGMTDSTIPTSKAVVDYINHRFETISGGVLYRGTLDANNPTDNPHWSNAKQGYLFKVLTAGTIDTIELRLGDTLIINKDVTGIPIKNDFDVIPSTIDEIGDIKNLGTEAKNNLVSAVNEVNNSIPRWDGISVS